MKISMTREKVQKFIELDEKYMPIIRQLLREYGPCPNCAYCCKVERVSMGRDGMDLLERHDPKFFKEAIFKVWEGGNFVSLKSPCPYLKGNRCRAYNLRPMACKIYPFVMMYETMMSIVYCPFGERIINDILEFCKVAGVGQTAEATGETKEVMEETQKFFDEVGLRTGEVEIRVLNVPYEVIDGFMVWRKKRKRGKHE